MAVEWVEVTDNAVKIGLGSLITILGGWLTLRLTQQHEIKKNEWELRLKEIDKKTERHIDFIFTYQTLMQRYLYESCAPRSEDYAEYLRLHNIVTITSTPEIRLLAFDTQSKVSQFILSEAICTPGVRSSQLVQLSSENDKEHEKQLPEQGQLLQTLIRLCV